jgi:hypothetical protein
MMKTSKKFIALFSGAALLTSSAFAQTVATDPVGYTSTTLPAGAGNLFAPAFVNGDSYGGLIINSAAGASSTLTVSGSLASGAFDESSDVANVSKGYPKYYLEVLNDTNGGDSIDTEGLVIDIISNTGTTVLVAADTSMLGIQGDENVAIRKHYTLGDLFAGSTGLVGYTDAITIYNEDGPGTAVGHLPDGAGGFILGADFVTVSTDAPIYPGTGFVINNTGSVNIVPTGTVKLTDTQVVIYGGSVVNVVSAMKPFSSVDLASDGRLNDALADYTDAGNTYTTDGTLLASVGFLDDGAGGFVASSDFVTPVTVELDGTHQPIVINAGTGMVYKVSGVNIQ